MMPPGARVPRSAGDVLDAALARDPGHEALVASDARFSYAELDEASDRAAAALFALGVRRGDVVAASLPNASDAVVTFHATMRLGAVWLGINRNLAPPEKQFMLEHAEAFVFLVASGGADPSERTRVLSPTTQTVSVDLAASEWRALVAERAAYTRVRSDPTDPAGLAYTSGTTGRPKAVMHTHQNVLLPGAVLTAAREFGTDLRKGDCAALTILNMQVTTTLLVAQAGGTQVVMDRVDPLGVADWIRRERVSSWFGVPTLLHGLAHAEDVHISDLASLSDVWSGGAFVPRPIRVAFEARFGLRVHATYGLTEAPTVVTIEPRDGLAVPDSSGRALPHLCVEVRDEAGAVLPAGTAGEITVRARDDGLWHGAYSPMLGYQGNPTATAATVRDGVLYTGDIGELDHAGNLFVRDRRNALILRGGANVYPAEVERVLLEVSGVVGVAVIGIPDERLGQRVAAALELAPGVSLSGEDLSRLCAPHLARYKVPELWSFGALPRNAMGKVNRSEVEAWFADAQ